MHNTHTNMFWTCMCVCVRMNECVCVGPCLLVCRLCQYETNLNEFTCVSVCVCGDVRVGYDVLYFQATLRRKPSTHRLWLFLIFHFPAAHNRMTVTVRQRTRFPIINLMLWLVFLDCLQTRSIYIYHILWFIYIHLYLYIYILALFKY